MPSPTPYTQINRFARFVRQTLSCELLHRGLLIAMLALLSVPSKSQDAPATKSTPKPKVWKIAFDRTVAKRDYPEDALYSDILVMDSDGRGARRMTNDGKSHKPAWSPDGAKLLFLHQKGTYRAVPYLEVRGPVGFDMDISVLDSNGGEPLEESLGQGYIPQAAWSADGKSITVDFRPGPRKVWDKTGIYSVDLDRADTPPLLVRDAYHFAWSPDGKRLAYDALRGKRERPAIYVSMADGSGEHRLTDPELKADYPAWSPDERRFAIAVEHGMRDIPPGLYVMSDDGASLKNLTGKKSNVQSPVWSPDGKRIAFLAGKEMDTQIFVVNADGSNLRQLTNEKKLYCHHPSWSPDGAELVYDCGPHTNRSYFYNPFLWGWYPRFPEYQIFLTKVDEPNAKPIQLTRDGGSNPTFSPNSHNRDDTSGR